MKRARVAYSGAIHEAIEEEGRVKLNDGRIVNEHDVVWLPPVEPRTVFALGLNYADHAKELAFNAPDEPLVFLKGPNTFIGHRGQTRRPADVSYMHYECELAVVIGRRARNVKREDAYDYVAGYTIANDYAIRDYLENYYRPNLRVKNRDTCTPIGPWLVDAKDVQNPMNLTIRTTVNGKITQEGSTKDMIFDIPYQIEYLSSFMTLNEGDIILTGTPEGAVDTAAGDEVAMEIEGLGRLVNTIVGDDTFFNLKDNLKGESALPHIIVEYTDNIKNEVSIPELLKKMNRVLIARSPLFPTGGIRSRAIELMNYRVADGKEDDAFVHVTLKIGAGRSIEVKKAVCDELFGVIKEHFAELFSKRYLALSMELIEFSEAGTYKHNNIHQRFKN